jgi:tripartite-type tricarboxylate transporter receptor subunit TctC
MKLPRRKFLHLAAGAAALPAMSRMARAQAYPSRPVRIVVGFPPGGSVDITARLIGQWLSERLGQPFVIENRPGAGTNIGTEAVVRAPGDGYTLLLASQTNAVNATLYDKLNYNFIHDIAPVVGISREPNVNLILMRSVLLSLHSIKHGRRWWRAEPSSLRGLKLSLHARSLQNTLLRPLRTASGISAGSARALSWRVHVR